MFSGNIFNIIINFLLYFLLLIHLSIIGWAKFGICLFNYIWTSSCKYCALWCLLWTDENTQNTNLAILFFLCFLEIFLTLSLIFYCIFYCWYILVSGWAKFGICLFNYIRTSSCKYCALWCLLWTDENTQNTNLATCFFPEVFLPECDLPVIFPFFQGRALILHNNKLAHKFMTFWFVICVCVLDITFRFNLRRLVHGPDRVTVHPPPPETVWDQCFCSLDVPPT